MAAAIAKDLGLNADAILSFPAEWTEYGKAAGPIRNREMLRSGKPDLVTAFHRDLNQSKGTRDMVEQARAATIPVWISGRDYLPGN